MNKNLHRGMVPWRIVMALVCGAMVSCSSAPVLLPVPTDESLVQWNAAVSKHVLDPQRASKMKYYGQQLFALQDSLKRDLAELNRHGLEFNEHYQTTRAQVRQVLDEFNQKRLAALIQYRDLIFAMRREVTSAEWKALTD